MTLQMSSRISQGRQTEHPLRLTQAVQLRYTSLHTGYPRRDTQCMVQEEIRELLQADIIEPSTSPWASPIVLVPKKDGCVWTTDGSTKSPLQILTRCREWMTFSTVWGRQDTFRPWGLDQLRDTGKSL